MRGDRKDNVQDQSREQRGELLRGPPEPHHGHQRKDEGRAVCPTASTTAPAVRRNKHGLVETRRRNFMTSAVETHKGDEGGKGSPSLTQWVCGRSGHHSRLRGFASKFAKTEPSGGCTIVPLWDWRNTSAHAPTQPSDTREKRKDTGICSTQNTPKAHVTVTVSVLLRVSVFLRLATSVCFLHAQMYV